MNHSFDVNLAARVGILEALIISYLETNTCVNTATMMSYFIYSTEKQLAKAINHLCKLCIIKVDGETAIVNSDLLELAREGAKITIAKDSTIKIDEVPDFTYSEDSIEYMLSALLLEKILENKPDFKRPVLQRWAEHMNKLINLDKKSPEKIMQIIEMCQADSFWHKNILCAATLRRQFDRLELKFLPSRVRIPVQDLKLTTYYIDYFTKKFTDGTLKVEQSEEMYTKFIEAANNTVDLAERTKSLSKKKIVDLFTSFLDSEFEKQKTITPNFIGSFFTWKIKFPQYIKQIYPEIKL